MDSQGPVEGDEQEDSDYIEVRCSVSHLDDYDEHALTLRVLIIALFLITVSVGANAYWTFRYPSPTITTAVAVLAAWPVGRTLAHWTPKWTFHFPKLFGGHAVQLNPGYWSMKEHSLIAQMVMVSLNTQATYPMFSLSALDLPVFWNLRTPYSFAILFTFSSILFGAGLAGLGRRFLVKPASMIWPQNLQISLMINVLHAEPEPERGRMNRLKFFWIVFGVIFVWQIVPSFLFTALSTFNWICWIAPNNVAVNHIFGFTNGMALFPVTLDYTQLNYFASPTLAPWWAGANLGVGYLIMWVFIGTILYFKNALNFGYLPFNGPSSSDKFGHRYNAPRVLKGQDFDPEAYENYSPLYLTVASYLDFWSSLALAGALLVHTYLNFQNFIWMNLRTGTAEIDDVHARQMRRYKDVPDYLYGVMIVISFGFVVAAVKIYDLGLPVWGIIIGYALVGVYFLPVTILLAQTALVTTVVNVIGEFIIGYALPGRAIPNMIFKAFVVGSTLSGQTFSQALKMGHYMKIGPRFSLACQLSAMLWADVVLLAVKELMTARIPDLCSHNQASLLTCPGQRFYYSSSIVWGVIGPRRLFSSTANRISLSYALAAGALLPIPFWYLNRRYPRRIWKFVNVPLMLFGVPFAMAGDPVNTTAFVAINFIAQYIIRRRYFPIWDRYNYLAGAACDAAAATCGLLLFVSVQIPNVTLNWIGNIIWQNTRDQEGRGWIPIPPSGIPFPS
ncbi:OPT oligopeptide transporter [Tilletiaria anomala UBC 951]|uniref:OPT oligopeptide transporter n=1 Tax=Tilletiaria anomala (strain ATCC 24038 / CBS 436.72 / UBC 951) TaxID=1037660 RepID=A0A066WGR9_TILAU|nr:OPT oligopeptide transporter [Tilletiaria anomala UBC 951]KDN52996.1 OPT oligopeptide transporter [Tilletiaria anomala UBC 951]